MVKAPIPNNEAERLEALYSYSILDTLPEDQYDNITRLAAQICHTPVSQITLVDSKRQWYKSNYGTEVQNVPRDVGFCAHTINEATGLLIVPDMSEDDRFKENPLVKDDPQVAFYAGICVKTPSGHSIGSLCVIDLKPRELNTYQIEALTTLADLIVQLFELNKSKKNLKATEKNLMFQNKELQRFASVAAHDIKSPLMNISSAMQLVLEKNHSQFSEEAVTLLSLAKKSALELSNMIDGILEISKKTNTLVSKKNSIELSHFFNEISDLIVKTNNVSFEYPGEKLIYASKTGLQQVFINLITNAIKHNDKESPVVKILFEEHQLHYEFSVTDNGPGIDKRNHERIFQLFNVLNDQVDKETFGYGMGLCTVKRLVELMGGMIEVDSEIDKGCTFKFSISK